MLTRMILLFSLLISTVSANDATTRVEITSDTLTWNVSSNWNFSSTESSTEADERLQNSVWQLLSGMLADVPATSVEKLPSLLLDRNVQRHEQTEERPRAYGTQFRTSVTLTLPRAVAENWLTQQAEANRVQHRSRWWLQLGLLVLVVVVSAGC